MKHAINKVKATPIADSERVKTMAIWNAQNFLSAYEVLRSHAIASLEKGAPTLFNASIASIVNLTFAIELFLKGLLYEAGLKATGHHLAELFEHLPAQTQSEIKNTFKERVFRKTGRSHYLLGLSFEDRLYQYSEIFNRWRYFHENNCGSFYSEFCENLADSLNTISKMRAERVI